ncbi:hypothetical protein B0F90DRAFT_1184118 [Multifurca ochricompacta]|uniref:Uncharacterized protein n=1 Tax=Multifurca ochricompacta TaxID=376703 RepID=A0AAD4QQF1_9AGAM|nr:hypothetical protein B0F90DRAFT_1184118 [Multifurca ochricompacta]
MLPAATPPSSPIIAASCNPPPFRMVLSILNSDPSLCDTENISPQSILVSPQKSRRSNRRSRAHNIPGGIKHLSDPKRRRRVSSRSTPSPLFTRSPPRPPRLRIKSGNTAKNDPLTAVTPVSESQHPQTRSPAPISITFPRRLPDLPSKPISSEVLASLGFTPEVPAQYIRDRIDLIAPSMYQALRSTHATASGTTLPKTFTISSVSCPTSAMLPTHMAAVYSSSPSAPEPRRVTLYPIHQSILSLYCANLPVLTPSTPRPTTPGSSFEVPVVPLALPHPESFSVLVQFLYLKDVQPLLETFLCLTPAGGLPTDLDQPARYDAFVVEYSTILAQNYTAQRLACQAAKIHGFWRNAYALGISDVDLQAFYDMAWEVLMKALVLSGNCAPAIVSA